jgi:hypothetical protein
VDKKKPGPRKKADKAEVPERPADALPPADGDAGDDA